jgi:hypothetical protein
MDEESSTDRRPLKFWLAMGLIAIAAFAVWLAFVLHAVGSRSPNARLLPATAADMKALVAHINGPKKSIGHIANIRVTSAVRLGEIGPPGKQFGAVEGLEALIANSDDPKETEAAESALKKINGK